MAQLQQLSKVAQAGAGAPVEGTPAAGAEFGNLLTKAIDNVNQQQMESGRLANQIETGDGGVSLVKAMIASQKAGVAFQATVQVRNRVVSAYQDIMNMPI
ncbi:MAG: flagellar hook-basal body complex protein FliE [Kangiellaceae bacterium]|nr:flagellar hook-basal body complex protein FliE [Kangiellaceae bacterium]